MVPADRAVADRRGGPRARTFCHARLMLTNGLPVSGLGRDIRATLELAAASRSLPRPPGKGTCRPFPFLHMGMCSVLRANVYIRPSASRSSRKSHPGQTPRASRSGPSAGLAMLPPPRANVRTSAASRSGSRRLSKAGSFTPAGGIDLCSRQAATRAPADSSGRSELAASRSWLGSVLRPPSRPATWPRPGT